MSHAALWYLTRGTGVVSLVLLTVVVLLGVVTRSGATWRRLPSFVTSGLHRNAALLAVAFLGVHVTTAVADPYAPIRVVDAVVPFTSAYRPVWLGLGALALDLVAALVVTSLLRTRLRPKLWRAVHWLAYAAWPVAVVHALGTGSDVRRPWLLALVSASVVAVVWAVLWRLLDLGRARRKPVPGRPRPRARSAATAALVAAAPLALAGWTLNGPLAAGWAARAGTPAGLLHQSAPAVSVDAARPSGTANLSGTLSQQRRDDAVTLTIAGRLAGSSAPALDGGSVVVALDGRPLGDDGGSGGVQLTSGVVTLRSSAGTYTGPVTGLSGGEIAAALTGPSGAVRLTADVRVSGASTTGTVTVV